MSDKPTIPEGFEQDLKEHMAEMLEWAKSQKNGSQGQSVSLSDVPERELEWVWPGRIPLNKPVLIGGDPGKGKTMLALDLAARVSTGTTWPDGQVNQAGNVLILTAEDDLADTIIPRLRVAGANLSKIFALQTVKKYDPKTEQTLETLPNLVDDFSDIETEIHIRGPRLIIVDPLNGFLPGIDTHRDAEMRSRVFAPMKRMLENSGAALIYIVHLNKSSGKSATHRFMGSMANVAAARSSWLVVDDKDSNDKLFVPDKFNVAKKPDGMAFQIIENQEGLPVIAWSPDPVDINADEALHPDMSTAPEREAAEEFLIGMLSDGSVPASDIYSEAEAFDISKRTLKRAKKKLEISAYRTGSGSGRGEGKWWWKLPESFKGATL